MPEIQNPNLTPETKIVSEIFAALNRNDIPGVLQFFDPEIVRIEPAGHDTAGTYRGHAEVGPHLAKGRSTWAEGTCEPARFVVVGTRVVAWLVVHVRLKDKTDWIDGRLADVFTFKNGKVIEMRTFWETEDALKWVGVEL